MSCLDFLRVKLIPYTVNELFYMRMPCHAVSLVCGHNYRHVRPCVFYQRLLYFSTMVIKIFQPNPGIDPSSRQNRLVSTVESRFLEPPGETQIGSRNREFEKSKVASNYAKSAGYCLVMSKSSNFNKIASF